MSVPAARARPRQVLDRRRILEAALRLVDAHGLEALSMRKLGAELGVEAMALYYHLPNKAALVQGMLGLVLEELGLPSEPPPNADWADLVRQSAVSFRQLGLSHPNLFPLLANVGLDNPASVAPTEAVMQLLASTGLTPREAFVAFVTLKSYVVGHTLWVIGDAYSGVRSGEAVCELLPRDISAIDFPVLTASAEQLLDQDVDANFLEGLELVIDGIRAQLQR